MAAGTLLGFAILAVAAGLAIVLGDDPSPAAARVGLTLYAAGAPVSGLFAAVAGELPLTLYLDILVWVLAGAGVTRLAERGHRLGGLLAAVVAAALGFGLVVSSLIELA